MKRRSFLQLIPSAALLLGAMSPVLTAHAASAASYPAKSIRLVIPFAPGGVSDMMGRLVAEALTKKYGVTVVADNRPGASGHIGAQQVAEAAPDGYTLVAGTIGIHSAYASYKKLNYNPSTDLVPISILAEAGNLVLVPVDSPYKTFQDFLEDARRKPAQLTYGSAGAGSSVHMVTALFENMSKTELVHVPYKGSSPALTDLVSGRLDVMFDNFGSGMPYVKSGRLRLLAVTGANREPRLPDVPTIAESGVPGYAGTSWFALSAPSKVPAELLEKIQKDVHDMLSKPEYKQNFETLGVNPVLNTPAQAKAFVDAETVKWTEVIKAANLQLD